MASSVFQGSAVQVATAGALTGDGTASNKLGVSVDNATITINGSNQLVGNAAGAPTDATYLTQTANSSLSAEQALSSLSTGFMKVTTTTGVVSSVVSGTGVETWIGTPSFTNLNSALTGDSAVGLSATQTLTNKRITKRVVTAADATSVTPNSDNADITYQANTQTAGTLTMNADGGTPTNGQPWVFKIKSTNVQTFAWNGVFVGGTTALPTASTGSSKIDYFAFIYDTVNSKWDYTGSGVGF